MARAPQPTDYVVSVEGVGAFTFQRRTIRANFAVRAEYARLSEGEPLTEDDELLANAIADLKVLSVAAPDGWNVDGMDATDPDAYATVLKVWGAFREKERSFRPDGGAVTPSGEGQGA